MKSKIISELKIVLNYFSYPSNNIIIQNTKNPNHGDYSTNIAMILSAKLKKNPDDIADEIKNKKLKIVKLKSWKKKNKKYIWIKKTTIQYRKGT